MQKPTGQVTRATAAVAAAFSGPPALAFVPAITLGAFWLGGEGALILAALGLPLTLAALRLLQGPDDAARAWVDPATGLTGPDGFREALQAVHAQTSDTGPRSCLFLLELDDFPRLRDMHGQAAADDVARTCGERLRSALRDGDCVARLEGDLFAVCLAPVRLFDLESAIRLAGRMQSAIEEPVPLDGLNLYVSCSVGFCLRSRAPGDSAEHWAQAARKALDEARRNGPSAIRAFSAKSGPLPAGEVPSGEEVARAFEQGQIKPWFQPQLSTDTGRVSGFEVLARWEHPDRGVLAPGAFLPALAEAGLMGQLGRSMLFGAFTALRAWDTAGVHVPRIGVNFSTDELRDPDLVERIRWELDRFELMPERLSIEILETVVADDPDDTVLRNLNRLGAMGCGIDLDDFGTGLASISAIRRFPVSRIKIDRSFVARADRDPAQQKMVAAILGLAERLELDTLAEGVETVGEHALLAQLGCGHVQGYGIGRPMPFEETLDWMARHHAGLGEPPAIGRETG